jgi:photosystem II stability/assembly factor-like uncharacterized protein
MPVTRTYSGSTLNWTLLGPQPVNVPSWPVSAGRISALAVDARNADVVYAGAADGGVWKTVDGGQNWTPLTDNQATLAIGALALDPSNPDIVYAGTGDLSGYTGAGILKSFDAGKSWSLIPGPFVGRSISGLAVQPGNTQVVLAASGAGICRSSDAGSTWQCVLMQFATTVLFDPGNPQVVYASTGSLFGGGGVFKSTDAGLTWKPLNGTGTNTLPSNMGRVALAVSRTSPPTLIAGVEIANNNGPATVFRSTDGGVNWISSGGQTYCWGACWYNNAVQFNPTDAKVVVGGGDIRGLAVSFDGGVTWQPAQYKPGGSAIHPDIQVVAFSSDGTRVYVGCDGGVWRANDLTSTGATWKPVNQTFAITQFYSGISLHPTDPNIIFGGTQDNTALRASGSLVWDSIDCGDGFSTAIDPTTPTTVFVYCGGNNLRKSTSGGTPGTFRAANLGIPTTEGDEVRSLAIDPSKPSNLYFGGWRYVYQSTNGAANWTPISSNLTSGQNGICAVAVAPSDSATVYGGTCDGFFWSTANALGRDRCHLGQSLRGPAGRRGNINCDLTWQCEDALRYSFRLRLRPRVQDHGWRPDVGQCERKPARYSG